eukprot:5293123-Amphidinium_carterae.1
MFFIELNHNVMLDWGRTFPGVRVAGRSHDLSIKSQLPHIGVVRTRNAAVRNAIAKDRFKNMPDLV